MDISTVFMESYRLKKTIFVNNLVTHVMWSKIIILFFIKIKNITT